MAWAVPETLARCAAYKLLSLAFLPPTPRTVAWLAALDGLVPELPPPHRAALAAASVPADAPGEAPAAAEHTRLFGVGLAASPYETEYDPLATVRKGHRLADLQGFYAAFGFRLAADTRELPDHVAVELEFMSVLLLKAAHAAAGGLGEAAEVCEAAAAAFLRDHLAPWGATFAERVERAAASGFYRWAAARLRAFLEAECRWLGIEASEPGPAPLPEREPVGCPFAGGPAGCAGLPGGLEPARPDARPSRLPPGG